MLQRSNAWTTRRFDELAGQPIKQVRMCGRRTLRAEIVFRLDQAAPEVLLPKPIDCHAGGERIGGIDDPASEVEAGGGGSVERWSVGALERCFGWCVRVLACTLRWLIT